MSSNPVIGNFYIEHSFAFSCGKTKNKRLEISTFYVKTRSLRFKFSEMLGKHVICQILLNRFMQPAEMNSTLLVVMTSLNSSSVEQHSRYGNKIPRLKLWFPNVWVKICFDNGCSVTIKNSFQFPRTSSEEIFLPFWRMGSILPNKRKE